MHLGSNAAHIRIVLQGEVTHGGMDEEVMRELSDEIARLGINAVFADSCWAAAETLLCVTVASYQRQQLNN